MILNDQLFCAYLNLFIGEVNYPGDKHCSLCLPCTVKVDEFHYSKTTWYPNDQPSSCCFAFESDHWIKYIK